MVQTPQSLHGNPGGGGGVGGGSGGGGGGGGGGGDVNAYHNPSAASTPVNSAASSLDSQTQTSNLYGDGRDYSSPVALEHIPSPWQHHLSQHPSHSFSPAPNAGGQQDRSFKTEPEHATEFAHAASRSESVTVNEGDRVNLPLFIVN